LRRLGYTLVFASAILAGCSGSNIFSTTYQNFLAYFNTFHNARKGFSEGEEEIRKAQPKILETNPFASTAIPQTARTKFESVIEKCSRIIQFHPQSTFVDDALLLIGKSYLYMKEILPATKKFTELLDNYPSSDLRFEARLGLARAHYAGGDVNDAFDTLKSTGSEATTAGENDVLTEVLLFEGQIAFDRKDYAGAIPPYQQSMETPGRDEQRALAAYQLGQCYELRENTLDAASAYTKVLDFDPTYVLEFHARLRAAIMYSKSEDHEHARVLIDQLLEDKPTPELRPLAEFEKANVLRRQSALEAALQQYALVDSLFPRTDVAARSYYEAALIYEKKFQDLPKAKTYYDKATSEFIQSEITADATRKAEILNRYLSYANEFRRYDSLLTRYLHPEHFTAPDSATTYTDSTQAGRERQNPPEDSLTVGVKKDSSHTAVAIIPIDTVHHKRAANEFALGVLFFIDLDRPDSARFWLDTLLHEYPETEFAPHALYVLEESYRTQDLQPQADSVKTELRTRYPKSVFATGSSKNSDASPHADSADSLYEQAMRLFDQRMYAQSLTVLRLIAKVIPKSVMGAKARYTMGWIYENILVKNDSAIAQYRKLVDEHPNSVYSERVRPKLATLDVKTGQVPSHPALQSPQNQPEPQKKQLPPALEKSEENPDTSGTEGKRPQ